MVRRGSNNDKMGPIITLRNLQTRTGLNLARLQKSAFQIMAAVLELSARRTTLRSLPEVTIVLISDCHMTRLHKRFLDQSGPTDVLTFAHGEIVISVDTARKNARSFKNSLIREVQLYIIHGLLHLHGYNDSSPGAARRMDQTQQQILNSLN